MQATTALVVHLSPIRSIKHTEMNAQQVGNLDMSKLGVLITSALDTHSIHIEKIVGTEHV